MKEVINVPYEDYRDMEWKIKELEDELRQNNISLKIESCAYGMGRSSAQLSSQFIGKNVSDELRDEIDKRITHFNKVSDDIDKQLAKLSLAEDRLTDKIKADTKLKETRDKVSELEKQLRKIPHFVRNLFE